MDHATRDEVSAAVGAHAELGNDYSDALAEGLVERIGAEIDKRVDEKLARRGTPQTAPSSLRSPVGAIVVPLGTIGMGVVATAFTMLSNVRVGPVTASSTGAVSVSVGGTQLLILAIIWAAIAVANLAYFRRR